MARTTTISGVWKNDSVQDVAESVGITNLPDEVATALAGDVEFRLWEIIEESIKFMKHSRRTRLKVEDLDNALKVKNIEPLWGFSSTSHVPFKKTITSTGTIYHLDDEEIDLSKVLKLDLPSIPRDVSFTAHWLAIEGVQPLIKENPTPADLAKLAPRTAAPPSITVNTSNSNSSNTNITPLVKHVLSRELQLYFTRLTEALSTPSIGTIGGVEGEGGLNYMREAALGSVRSDPGLHQLVPYLVGWGGEQIANHLDDLNVLDRALALFHAMLENPTFFIEPYLHQLTPPILTCLLTSALPTTRSTSLNSHSIRTTSSSLLQLLLSRHSTAYPSLRPRITKTLLRGLVGPNRGLEARWGAARGLKGIVGVGGEGGEGEGGGNLAVREWIGGGLKVLGEMLEGEEEENEGVRMELVEEILDVLEASLVATPLPSNTPLPSLELVSERYGRLIGLAILERWETKGGREIFDTILGSSVEDKLGEGEGEEEDEVMNE